MKIIIPWPAIKTVIMYAIKSNLSVKKRTLASHPIPITIVSDIEAFINCLQNKMTNNKINTSYLILAISSLCCWRFWCFLIITIDMMKNPILTWKMSLCHHKSIYPLKITRSIRITGVINVHINPLS